MNDHSDVAPGLVALRRIASRNMSCSINVIHHVNRSLNRDPIPKAANSLGITATGRHMLFVGVDPDARAADPDTTKRVVALSKTNLTSMKNLAYGFDLGDCENQKPFAWLGSSQFRAQDSDAGYRGRGAGGARPWPRRSEKSFCGRRWPRSGGTLGNYSRWRRPATGLSHGRCSEPPTIWRVEREPEGFGKGREGLVETACQTSHQRPASHQ